MTDDRTELTERALDDLFATVRSATPEPGADFMARLFADIDMVAAEQAAPVVAPAPAKGGSLLRGLFGMLGGWAGTGSLAAAAVAGVWMGFAPPAMLENVTNTILGESVSVDVFATTDILGLEG